MYLNQISESDPSYEIDSEEIADGNGALTSKKLRHMHSGSETQKFNSSLKVSQSKAQLKQIYKKSHQVIK